jgi:hypothetical protein
MEEKMSAKIPPLDELREKYAEVMADKAVTALSNWKEPNSEEPCDENAYVQRAIGNADVLNAKLKEAMFLE